jgi:branched-chain amino acid aminotransferase
MTRQDIFNADECFLTGTGAELMPVIALDGRKIGDGKPGPVTAMLLKEFRSLHAREGEDLFA